MPLSGAYVKGGPAALTAFGDWRRRPVELAHTYLPAKTWGDLAMPTSFLNYWRPYADRMMLSLPMLPSDGDSVMTAGAIGRYDPHWRALGGSLVAAGMGNAILRPGWECNGSWFPWAAQPDPELYIRYWRKILIALRQVPGQSFRFFWCVSNPYLGWDARAAYPGDAYVNFIGVDCYDTWWQHPATPAERWNFLVNSRTGEQAGGLAFWTDFSAARGKRFAVGEWGLVNEDAAMVGGSGGGGDDPLYVHNLLAWAREHKAALECYFNHDAPEAAHKVDGLLVPQSSAAYQEALAG